MFITSTRLASDLGVSSVIRIRSLSSLTRLARSSLPARPARYSLSRKTSSPIRAEICSSRFISGWTFWVRIDSSSTRLTALHRRRLRLASKASREPACRARGRTT